MGSSQRDEEECIETKEDSKSIMKNVLLTPLRELHIYPQQHQQQLHPLQSDGMTLEISRLLDENSDISVLMTSASTHNRRIFQNSWMSPHDSGRSFSWIENAKPPPSVQHDGEAFEALSTLSLFCKGEDDKREEECNIIISEHSSLLTILTAASSLQLHSSLRHLRQSTGGSLSAFYSFCQDTFLSRLTSSALHTAWMGHLEAQGVSVVLPRATLLFDAAKEMQSRGGGAIAISPKDDRDAFIGGMHPHEILLASDFDLALQMAQLLCCANLREVTVGDFVDVVRPMRRSGGVGEIGYGNAEDLEGWLKCNWEQLPACLIIRKEEAEGEILVTPPVLVAILSRAILNAYEDSGTEKDEEEEKSGALKIDRTFSQEEASSSFSPIHSESSIKTLPAVPRLIVRECSQLKPKERVIDDPLSPPKTPSSPAPPLMLSIADDLRLERDVSDTITQTQTDQHHRQPSSGISSSYPLCASTIDGRDLLDLCWKMKNERAKKQRCRHQENVLDALNNRHPPPLPPLPSMPFSFGGKNAAARQAVQQEVNLPLPLPGRVLDEAETTSSFRPDVPLALLDPYHPLFAAAVHRKLRAPATPVAYTTAPRSLSTLATSPRQSSYLYHEPSPVHSSYSSAPTDISDAPKKARRYIAKVRALQRQHEMGVEDVGTGENAQHALLLAQYAAGDDNLMKREDVDGGEGVEGHLHMMACPHRRASVSNNIDNIIDVEQNDDDDDDDGSITTDVMELIAGDVNFLPPPETLLETERLGQKVPGSRPPALLDLTPASRRQQSIQYSPCPHHDSPLLPPPSTIARPLKKWHTILPSFFSSSRSASPITALHHTGSCIDTTSTSTTVRIPPFFSMPFRKYKSLHTDS